MSVDRDLVLKRRFPAPCEQVFDAFVNNELTRASFVEAGFDCEVSRDVREGGAWEIKARKGAMELRSCGHYVDVSRPHRIVHTFAMPQFSPNQDVISINLEPVGENFCLVTYTQSGSDIATELASAKAEEASASEAGWMQMFDAIEAHLTRRDGRSGG